MKGWIYRNVILSFPTIFGGCDYIMTFIIFIPLTIFSEGVNISWHYIFTPDNIWWGGDYIVTIFSLLTIFGQGVIISWHYIFTPDNVWCGGDYIVTSYFHCWQYLVRGWLYRDTIFSPLTIFGEGVIISWHHIFTPDNISWGGDYIVTWYSYPWQYLVRGGLYRDIIFSLLAIFGQGVIISWHIFTPHNIQWGGKYIVTLYFHSW